MGNSRPSPIPKEKDLDDDSKLIDEFAKLSHNDRSDDIDNKSSINTSDSIPFKDVVKKLNYSSESKSSDLSNDRKNINRKHINTNDDNPKPPKRQRREEEKKEDGKKTKLSSYKKNKIRSKKKISRRKKK